MLRGANPKRRLAVFGLLLGGLGAVWGAASLWSGTAPEARIAPPGPDPKLRDFRRFLRSQFEGTLPEFPASLPSEDGPLRIQYTFDEALQKEIGTLISRYAPDYAALAAIEADTGRVIALVNYAKHDPAAKNLVLKASFPAASIFKIVTAAAALETQGLDADSVIAFNGGSHTLYRKNIEQTQVNRWTRYMSLKDAFARSINTVFGKLGAFHVGPDKMGQVASRFGFNESVESDLPFETGVTRLPANADPYEIAEIASGFNRDSSLSVLHGALIGGVVATDGLLMRPYVVDAAYAENGERVFGAKPEPWARTLEVEKAHELRELMRATVEAGTSRKSFRQVHGLKRHDELEVGGKTGSLVGGEPRGKCDWFVGYLRHDGPPIAIGVLTVNPDKWTVRSSYLAARFFDAYLKRHGDTAKKDLASGS